MTERRSGFGRWVCDTHVLVSGLLWPRGTAGRAFALATQRGGKLLMSEATLGELHHVLFRPKFDRFASRAIRADFLAALMPLVELVPASAPVRACRDPKDDKFLEVALHGNADALISGDDDLCVLDPFHGVPILRPVQFVALFEPPDDVQQAPPPHTLREPRPSYTSARMPDLLAAFLARRHGLLPAKTP